MGDANARVLSTKEAAAFLGVSRTEVQRAIARGLLPFVDRAPMQPRLGVPHDALVAFAAQCAGTGVTVTCPRVTAAAGPPTEQGDQTLDTGAALELTAH